MSTCYFWSHVLGSTCTSVLSRSRFLNLNRQPEVRVFDNSLRTIHGDKNVLRFDVTMQDVELMHLLESHRKLCDPHRDFVDADRSLRYQRSERSHRAKFEDDKNVPP